MLLEANRVVPRERVVEALWTTPPKSADKIVRMYVARLQKLLGGDVVRVAPGGYELSARTEAIDALRFERLVAEARAAEPAAAAAILRDALGLWRGAALGELAYSEFARAAAERLEEARLEALEECLAAELVAGSPARVVGELEALVASEPLRERPRELLMLALYRSGRQAEALREYTRARTALIEQLGIEPSPRLRRLERAILRQDPSLEAAADARHPLAAAPTPFFGREREIERALALLSSPEVRLLTLTGTGGIGKTRLALELGRRLAGEFPDGVHVVSLGSVADPALVLPTIARVFDVFPLEGDAGAALRLHLRDRSALLVLDSFEHLIAGAAEVATLLAAAPGLKVLVTSTARLHLSSERELVVPPLAALDSVELFAARAQAVNDEFSPEDHADAIAEICRRLEGLPLAIELAAARTKLLPPQAMLERLGRRLELLGGGSLDAPPRQRTLRGTIEWSFGLLDPREQRLFARLGVFAGGCTLDAAEAVCGGGASLVDELAALVDKSLLRSRGDGPRLSMLDTLREFALERLEQSGDLSELRTRHAGYFLDLAERAEPELTGAGQAEWYERLEAEHDNIRAALAHLLAVGDAARALRLATALARFWDVRGHALEGRRWLIEVLASGGEQPRELRARALLRAAVLSIRRGDAQEVRPLLEESLELGGGEGEGLALLLLGYVSAYDGDLAASVPLFERAAAAYRDAGDERGVAVALNDLGVTRSMLGDYAAAAAACDEAAALSGGLGDRQAAAAHLVNASFPLLELGREDEAIARIERSVEIAREIGSKLDLALALAALAAVAVRRGDRERAARLLGAAEALQDSTDTAADFFDRANQERVVAALGGALESGPLAAVRAEGRTLSVDDALAEALGRA